MKSGFWECHDEVDGFEKIRIDRWYGVDIEERMVGRLGPEDYRDNGLILELWFEIKPAHNQTFK